MKTIILLLSVWLACCSPAPAQTFRWVKTGLNNNVINDLSAVSAVAQANGQVVTTGYFVGYVAFDNQVVSSLNNRNAFAGGWEANGTTTWLSPALSTSAATGTAVGLDAAGNSYVCYYVHTDVTFGTTYVPVPAGQVIAALVKYTPTGQVTWVQTIETGQYVVINSIAVAANGSCTVGGSFVGNLALAGQPPVSSGPRNDPDDGFIARYSPSGTCLWARAISALQSQVHGLNLDSNGNVLVAGDCGDPTNFGNGVTLAPTNYNGFLAKYDGQGVIQWAQLVGNGSADSNTAAVATDGAGSSFVCGFFGHDYGRQNYNTGTFGSFALTTRYNYGIGDGYLAKYDAQGTCQWVQPVQGADLEWLRTVAVNQRGEVYLGGAAYGGVNFGATTLTANTFGYQGFVAKYSSAGALRWLQGYGGSGSPFGGSNRNAGLGMATDGMGRVYVCGAFQGNTFFGPVYASGPNQSVEYPYLAALDDQEVLATAPGRTTADALVAYPNPSTGTVQLRWDATVRPRQVQVLDAVGRPVRTLVMAPAQTTATLHLDDLAKGLYLLHLTTDKQPLTQKILLE